MGGFHESLSREGCLVGLGSPRVQTAILHGGRYQQGSLQAILAICFAEGFLVRALVVLLSCFGLTQTMFQCGPSYKHDGVSNVRGIL